MEEPAGNKGVHTAHNCLQRNALCSGRLQILMTYHDLIRTEKSVPQVYLIVIIFGQGL